MQSETTKEEQQIQILNESAPLQQEKELEIDPKVFKKKQWWRNFNLYKINLMLFLIIIYFCAELIVGILANSLTLIADAFHMLSDGIGLVIGGASIIVRMTHSLY